MCYQNDPQRSDLLAVQRKQRPWCHLHCGGSRGEEGGRPTLGWLCVSGPADMWSAPWGLQSSHDASIYEWEYRLEFVCSSPVQKTQNNHFPAVCTKYFALNSVLVSLPQESCHTRSWNKGLLIPTWVPQLSDSLLSCLIAPDGLSASCHCPQTERQRIDQRQSGEILYSFCFMVFACLTNM